jgi:hypothetical protein
MSVSFDIDGLRSAGFTGFHTVADLRTNPDRIPSTPGVYIVLFTGTTPQFVVSGTGGRFKGKDPNVSVDTLRNEWVNNTPVIYIGKAGGANSSSNLRKRIKQYLQFGEGKPVGHYGGRFIWQISNSDQLVFCWMSILDREPRDVEMELINSFNLKFGKFPFANLSN